MPATIKDVAQAANVSKAAVSYVINDKPGVSEETRRRILRIMEEMKFRPNAQARGLAGRRTDILGLVIPDITDVFYVNIVRGVEAKANELGYTLNLCTTHGDAAKEKDVVDLLASGRVDGLIMMTYHLDPAYLHDLREREACFVIIADDPPEDKCVHSITVDNVEAGYVATEHLISLGHKHIAFIHGSEGSLASKRRFEGYEKALREHGLTPSQDLVARGGFQRSGGHKAAVHLLGLGPRPTALFAANDQMALGALAAAAELGLSVPGDVSIVGVDDIEAAALVTPALTTLRQPTYEMGSRAVEMLVSLLNGADSPETRVSFKATLVIRDSCARIHDSCTKAHTVPTLAGA